MFNEGFYPTPENVIKMMIDPMLLDYDGMTIFPHSRVLEPSAGKGDILDYIKENYRSRHIQFACVEIEPELQLVLMGKGYKVLDSDFLAYCEPNQFDLIIMNPPFANGVDHLLKAWEIMHTGEIVCLLNAETVRNPYTDKRKLLQRIIENHGSVEYIGQAFKDSERPTDVEVVIVRLSKKTESGNLEFEVHDFDAHMDDAEFSANPLAQSDMIQSIVNQYEAARNILIEQSRLESKFKFYTRGIELIERKEEDVAKEIQRSLQEKIDDLKDRFWSYVFTKTKIGEVTTSSFHRDFEKHRAAVSNMAFSAANIISVLETYFYNSGEIMQQCAVSVFDALTKYHKENRVYVEGWKSNKSWRVNHKVVLPNMLDYDNKRTWGRWSISYYNRDTLTDLDKIMCMVSGKRFETITPTFDTVQRFLEAINAGRIDYTKKFSSTFFEIKIFKKGTIHLVFKDADLLARFNQIAADNKNWMGDGS